jgi:hypothetical protein
MNNGRADDALPFFFIVSTDIIKREAGAQLFMTLSSVSIYFIWPASLAKTTPLARGGNQPMAYKCNYSSPVCPGK